MAAPVKPAKPAVPAATPVAAKPAVPAPAKPAVPVAAAPKPAAPPKPKVAPAPAPVAAAPTAVTAAPEAPATEATEVKEKKPRKRREGPAYAQGEDGKPLDIEQYKGNVIQPGPKCAVDDAGALVNPKRGKSADRFAKYAFGQTLEASMGLEGGPTLADIRWDIAHDLIVLQ